MSFHVSLGECMVYAQTTCDKEQTRMAWIHLYTYMIGADSSQWVYALQGVAYVMITLLAKLLLVVKDVKS